MGQADLMRCSTTAISYMLHARLYRCTGKQCHGQQPGSAHPDILLEEDTKGYKPIPLCLSTVEGIALVRPRVCDA